jgi:uncharacterized Fe-S cluster-containing MiaB family protein
MDLVHCIYCSTSTQVDVPRKALDDILNVARKRNAELEVTGILLFHSGSFFQVLEGDRPVIEALFEKIAADKRHTRAAKIILEAIPERAFSEWKMGFPRVSSKELAEIPGLSDFFTHGTSYMEIGEGRAKTLVAAFKDGRWRVKL